VKDVYQARAKGRAIRIRNAAQISLRPFRIGASILQTTLIECRCHLGRPLSCDINNDMEVTNEERSQQDPDVTREGKSDTRALVAISRDTPGEQLNAQSTYKRKKTVRITLSTMAKGQR
jgi:hypothetical protein